MFWTSECCCATWCESHNPRALNLQRPKATTTLLPPPHTDPNPAFLHSKRRLSKKQFRSAWKVILLAFFKSSSPNRILANLLHPWQNHTPKRVPPDVGSPGIPGSQSLADTFRSIYIAFNQLSTPKACKSCPLLSTASSLAYSMMSNSPPLGLGFRDGWD